MSYGFTCGYCLADIDAPGAEEAEARREGAKAGWKTTFGTTRHFLGEYHVTCPDCVPSQLVVGPL